MIGKVINQGEFMTDMDKFIVENQDMLKRVMLSVKESLVVGTSGLTLEQVDQVLDQVDDHLDNYVTEHINYLSE